MPTLSTRIRTSPAAGSGISRVAVVHAPPGRYRPVLSFCGEPSIEHQNLPRDIIREASEQRKRAAGRRDPPSHRCGPHRSARRCARRGRGRRKRPPVSSVSKNPGPMRIGGDAVTRSRPRPWRGSSCADTAFGRAVGEAIGEGPVSSAVRRNSRSGPSLWLSSPARRCLGSGKRARRGSPTALRPNPRA